MLILFEIKNIFPEKQLIARSAKNRKSTFNRQAFCQPRDGTLNKDK